MDWRQVGVELGMTVIYSVVGFFPVRLGDPDTGEAKPVFYPQGDRRGSECSSGHRHGMRLDRHGDSDRQRDR